MTIDLREATIFNTKCIRKIIHHQHYITHFAGKFRAGRAHTSDFLRAPSLKSKLCTKTTITAVNAYNEGNIAP